MNNNKEPHDGRTILPEKKNRKKQQKRTLYMHRRDSQNIHFWKNFSRWMHFSYSRHSIYLIKNRMAAA